jgi:nitric oxide reductase NorD protein
VLLNGSAEAAVVAGAGEAAFADVQRRLSFYLRALWGRDLKLQARAETGRRATVVEDTIRLPLSCGSVEGLSATLLYRATAAHAAAHAVFTLRRFPVGGLSALQVVLVALVEDARVEQLAIAEFPGLRRLWRPFHPRRSEAAVTPNALMARLSRVLLDETYDDSHPWVARGRSQFFSRRADWGDQAFSRELGGSLGIESADFPGGFDFGSYVVEPAYRDDHRGLWDFGDMAESAPEEDDSAHQGARGSESEKNAARAESGERSVELPEGEDEAAELEKPGGTGASPGGELPAVPLRYDEWDYITGQNRPAWTTLREKDSPAGDAVAIDAILSRNHELVDRVKGLVLAMQVQRPARLRRRLDGDRLDLDAAVNATTDLRAGISPDPRVHSLIGRQQRDLSVLVLLDLSQSTNDRVASAGTTVLDLAREATVLLADAMARIGDSFAIHGFCSNGRHDVGYFRFKDFDEHYGEASKARLAGMSGQLSTRMGAALRHAAQFLRQRHAHRKLILLITDGEPSDIDVHDGQYLMFDAKRATEESARKGIFTYCLSLDPKADRYVSRIFGQRNYSVLDNLARLPEKLPLLYMRVTR